MKTRVILLCLLALLSGSVPARAEEADEFLSGSFVSSACVSQVQGNIAQQQRVYRTVLFGRRDAKDEDQGTVRYAEDGSVWLKTGASQWRSDSKGYEGTTWSDLQVNNQTEWEGMNEPDDTVSVREPRKGVFTASGKLTSELIEPATQAFRALRCRMEMVCGALRESISGIELPEDEYLEISTPGCTELYMKPLDKCTFNNEKYVGQEAELKAIDAMSSAIVETVCDPLVREVMQREAEMLKLAVSYDASYRTLLQFAGNFDLFLHEFRGNLLSPIEDAMSLLGTLTRVPCFISACNG